jgi:hypothetical protein
MMEAPSRAIMTVGVTLVLRLPINVDISFGLGQDFLSMTTSILSSPEIR